MLPRDSILALNEIMSISLARPSFVASVFAPDDMCVAFHVSIAGSFPVFMFFTFNCLEISFITVFVTSHDIMQPTTAFLNGKELLFLHNLMSDQSCDFHEQLTLNSFQTSSLQNMKKYT